MAINKGTSLQQKLKAKLDVFGITVERIRPFYKTGSTTVGASSVTMKILDADSIGKRYQDINRFTDVGTFNQSNEDLTVFYVDGTQDIQEGDILTYVAVPYRLKITRVHPFVLQDVVVYFQITTARELQVGVTI